MISCFDSTQMFVPSCQNCKTMLKFWPYSCLIALSFYLRSPTDFFHVLWSYPLRLFVSPFLATYLQLDYVNDTFGALALRSYGNFHFAFMELHYLYPTLLSRMFRAVECGFLSWVWLIPSMVFDWTESIDSQCHCHVLWNRDGFWLQNRDNEVEPHAW